MRFTSKDIEVVKIGLNFLTFFERHILILRFWENKTIEEISKEMDLEWGEIDQSIEIALDKLRVFCLEHPQFTVGYAAKAA
jgi:DNA-directed RNA polymerase sigma subunit (sigma70/sigma32)